MTRNDRLNNSNNNNNYTYIRMAVDNRISNEIDRKIIFNDYNSFLQMTSVHINPFSHNLLSRNPVEKL